MSLYLPTGTVIPLYYLYFPSFPEKMESSSGGRLKPGPYNNDIEYLVFCNSSIIQVLRTCGYCSHQFVQRGCYVSHIQCSIRCHLEIVRLIVNNPVCRKSTYLSFIITSCCLSFFPETPNFSATTFQSRR